MLYRQCTRYAATSRKFWYYSLLRLNMDLPPPHLRLAQIDTVLNWKRAICATYGRHPQKADSRNACTETIAVYNGQRTISRSSLLASPTDVCILFLTLACSEIERGIECRQVSRNRLGLSRNKTLATAGCSMGEGRAFFEA